MKKHFSWSPIETTFLPPINVGLADRIRRGKVLYQNYFTRSRHAALKDAILNIAQCPWIVTYDDVPEIRNIYRGIPYRTFSLNYSLANNGTGREVMFFSNVRQIPTEEELASVRMDRNFRVVEVNN